MVQLLIANPTMLFVRGPISSKQYSHNEKTLHIAKYLN
jgi:hypothetical protein